MSDSKQATRLRRRDHWASLKRGRRYRATLDNNLKDKLSRRIKEKNHMS
jgi:hypothetical protein